MDIPVALDILIWLLGYLKILGKCLLSEFSHAERISACPTKITCNKREQNIMTGEILNAGENVDDQKEYWVYRIIFQNCTYKYRWLYKKDISEYATGEFETPEKYREQWQKNWWKILEDLY